MEFTCRGISLLHQSSACTFRWLGGQFSLSLPNSVRTIFIHVVTGRKPLLSTQDEKGK